MTVELLEKIHEDFVYIIECLAENLTSEAKYELLLLKQLLKENLQIAWAEEIINRVEEARNELYGSHDRKIVTAASLLAGARQRIRNEIEIQNGRKSIYKTI